VLFFDLNFFAFNPWELYTHVLLLLLLFLFLRPTSTKPQSEILKLNYKVISIVPRHKVTPIVYNKNIVMLALSLLQQAFIVWY